MPSFQSHRVAQILEERDGFQRMKLEDGSKAYALPAVVGAVEVGDVVVVNTTAVDLGLGTGGWHVVHSVGHRTEWTTPGVGHLLKARYLSEQLQVDPHVSERVDLVGARVLLCVLHSHLGAVSIALKSSDLGYLMTDQSALPLKLSDLVAQLQAKNLLKCTVTAGQAFGGDIEAVSVASGTAALLDNGCPRIVLAAGPGHAGTSSNFGFSAMELAGHAAVLTALGAKVGLCVRASGTDERQRHQGISHHARTILGAIPVPIDVPLPLDGDDSWVVSSGHHPCRIEPINVSAVIAESEIEVTSMGRPIAEDPVACAHLGAAAAWLGKPN